MEPIFKYRRIGPAFESELLELVSSGQSVLMLGHRDLGKSYALKKLGNALRAEGSILVVEVVFPHEHALCDAGAVQAAIRLAVNKAFPGYLPKVQIPDDALLGMIKQLCELQPRSVAFLVSNVDSLAHHIAQIFLREMRVLVSDRNIGLTTAITGEANLRDLVFGPDSEFNCAHQFVLEGFEENAHLEFLRLRRKTSRVEFIDEEACHKLLYRESQGNIHLARSALWSWLEANAQIDDRLDDSVTEKEFAAFVTHFPEMDNLGTGAFLPLIRVIESASASWRELEALLAEQSVTVLEGGAPHELELAGLAVRRCGRLGYASPMMERFAKRYYNNCRLGDLYAVQGDWDNAIRLYQRIEPEHRMRPQGTADYSRLKLVIKAFIAHLHSLATLSATEAADKVAALKAFFSNGCKLVLGVSDVTFWEFTVNWEPYPDQLISPDLTATVQDILRMANCTKHGWQPILAPHDKRAALAILPSVRHNSRNAVIASDPQGSPAISRERAEILRELFDQFTSAYHHVTANWHVKLRMQARSKHLEIATRIVTALGESVRNPSEAFDGAGKELLKLGYRRIMFALVDQAQHRIRGIADFVCDDATPDLARYTDWSLSDAEADIQPWVVTHDQECIVDNWALWAKRGNTPRINLALCQAAATKPAFAVVPMRLMVRSKSDEWSKRVFGTIHVERRDGSPPNADEIEDLIEFGRQMAAATQQSEQTYALLHALAVEDDEVIILDKERNVRFANSAAARRYSVSPGWHDANAGVRFIPSHHSNVERDVRLVLKTGGSKLRHVGSEDDDGPIHEAILSAAVPDWRQPVGGPSRSKVYKPIGVIVQVRDLSALERICAALRTVARQATDRVTTVPALLESVKTLGHQSGRLYLVDPLHAERLVSTDSFGLESDYAGKFRNGDYVFEKQDSGHEETWGCLVTCKPKLYCWNRSDPHPDESRTQYGLHVVNVTKPALDNSWKREGDYWLDLPLVSTGRIIGKLTIDCGHNYACELKPINFELFGIFSALLGLLLDALDQKERWVREAAERAMSETAHKIGTKLAGLSGFAEDYRRAAPGNLKVEAINRWMEPTVNDCFELVQQVKEGFTGIMRLNRTESRVRTLLDAALESRLGHERRNGTAICRVVCQEDLHFNLDWIRLQHALEAMFDNSRLMTPSTQILKLELFAETFQRDMKSWLRLTIKDNGPGIPVDQRERIFEALYSRRPSGQRSTGLGLSYVQRVISKHGGTVRAVEPTESGAEFIIEIPEQP